MTASDLTTEGHLDVPGGRIWYGIAGDGDGIPLITLHGGPGSPHDYLRSLSELGTDRPVIFYDQLGCGNSLPTGPTQHLWTLERFIQELDVVRRHLAPDRFHLYGHSWGAMLGLDYALMTEGLESLILASPCLSLQRVRGELQRLRNELPESVRRVLDECEANGETSSAQYGVAAMSFYRRHVCRMNPWPAVLEASFARWGHEVYNAMWGPSEFHVTGCLSDYERLDRLSELTVPTMFMCGRHDEITPEATQAFQSHAPGSVLEIFEESAHLPQVEEPQRHTQVVRDFLQRVESELIGATETGN